jgi:hypothetical protein
MEAAKLRIGITIGLRHEAESAWINGIKQNAYALAQALLHCRQVSSVMLVNTTPVAITPQLPWDLQRMPTASWDDCKDDLDVLIELGGQIDAAQTGHLKRRGAWLVSYCCGFEYVHAMESVLFGTPGPGDGLFVNPRYDAIWAIPQVAPQNAAYFATLRRRPVQVVPFVWDPFFLTARAAAYPHEGCYIAKPAGPRRLTVMEPNLNVVKFCLYPIFIAEEAFRRRPWLVSHLHVTNAERLARESREFFALMSQLDIVRQQRASFIGRFDTPQFLAEHTDAVISHQWENALNYFYLEVCWQGYPLVHNAHLCSDLGYYYPANDLDAGCTQLLAALDGHDARAADYLQQQRRLIARYLPGDPALTAAYEDLLARLVGEPPR